MKTITSLLPLQFGGKLLAGDLRQQPAGAQLGPAELLEEVAERATLELGERLEGTSKRNRKRNMDAALLAHGRYVATATDSGKQKTSDPRKVVDVITQKGHKDTMNNTDTPNTATKTASKYESNRRKIYISEWLHDALMELAKLNRRELRAGRSFSEIMARAGLALIRQPKNAARLRAAGIALPEAIFTKTEK